MEIDGESVRRSACLVDVARQQGVDLKTDGREHKSLCPFHDEKTPSFTIYQRSDGTQYFYCFGCTASGDVIDFIKKMRNVDYVAACQFLQDGKSHSGSIMPAPASNNVPSDPYAAVIPVPVGRHPFAVGQKTGLYNPKRQNAGFITPSLVHEYRTQDGGLYGLVLRQDLPGGKKETPTIRHVKLEDGTTCWSRFPFAKPRLLYGLDRLLETGPVYVVEGEKAADALYEINAGSVIGWAGGASAFHFSDWSPLKGRDVILWPDHDDPGRKAMLDGVERRSGFQPSIGQILVELDATVRFVDVGRYEWEAPLPKGHDVADLVAAGWDGNRILELIETCLSELPRPISQVVDDITQAERQTPVEVGNNDPEAPQQVPKLHPDDMAKSLRMPPRPASVIDLHKRATYAPDDAWQRQLSHNADGKPIPNSVNNHMVLLLHHPHCGGFTGFDAFSRKVMLTKRPPWLWEHEVFEQREIEDNDYPRAAQWLEQVCKVTPKPHALPALFQSIADIHTYDPLRDYLTGLRWDRTPRLDGLLQRYFGVEESDYATIISKRFMISAVARAMRPGCKMDTMLILEGPQGAMKSSGIRALFGDMFFADHLSDVESKDAAMEVQGVWCVEIAEMHSFTRAEANAVKKFITRQVDRFRPPYGRTVINAKRRCCLVGTINPDGAPYLKDPTGARRFWPVSVGNIDREAIEQDRDQLWAEAVVAFDNKNPWWIQPDEEDAVVVEQQARTAGDIWEGTLRNSVKTEDANLYPLRLALKALNLPIDRADQRHFDRIGRVMKKLGYVLKPGSATEFIRSLTSCV